MKPFTNTNHVNSVARGTGAASGSVAPALPRAYRIGPDAGLAVEYGWSTWRDAVADRAGELRAARIADRQRRGRWTAALAVPLVLAIDAGLVAAVVAAVTHPRTGLVVALAGCCLAGVAWGRRR